jgi:hypothetical protein
VQGLSCLSAVSSRWTERHQGEGALTASCSLDRSGTGGGDLHAVAYSFLCLNGRIELEMGAVAFDLDSSTALSMSLVQMPDDEFESLHWARYPRVAEVGRNWKEDATQAGIW